jgi:hypothetical protein
MLMICTQQTKVWDCHHQQQQQQQREGLLPWAGGPLVDVPLLLLLLLRLLLAATAVRAGARISAFHCSKSAAAAPLMLARFLQQQ